MHISFDHAQQVHYPSNPQQPGPAYFKTARKCQIFGICCEGSNTQLNYLIDEAEALGKGANSIVSLVHHYLENYSTGEQHLQIHADNCIGQNKNNITILYFGWRVLCGLHTSCSFGFMIPGHTRFGPDWFFGMVKRKYRRTRVSSMEQIAQVVENSTTEGQNKPFIVGKDTPPLIYYDWHTFFTSFSVSIPHITSYHHFRFDAKYPGVVFLRTTCNSPEKTFTFLKQSPPTGSLPTVLQPAGMDETRQWYLYEQIREFCEDEYKDITCPKPRVPKRKQQNQDAEETAAPAKRARLCSHCRQPGHTKTKKGVVTCPLLLQ